MDYYDDDVPGSYSEPMLVPGPPAAPQASTEHDGGRVPRRRRVLLPALLFIATCLSVYFAGWKVLGKDSTAALTFAAALMFILTTHELGHFIQALRYRVPASLPFFIPMPFSPIGTMGAVIGMQAHIGNRKALFDIGISGPLAGLVPTVICSVVGLHLSKVVDVAHAQDDTVVGLPLFFQLLFPVFFDPPEAGQFIELHALAFAGWVGVFITALNLIPIGQLDGGHVLYALLLRRAHRIAALLFFLAVMAVAIFGYWGWSVMLMLLFIMGPMHPPTADDTVPLGTGRMVLGWLTLAFVLLGFTPQPFYFLGG